MSNKRKYERYKVILPVKVESGKQSIRCASMDISSGGIGLLLSTQPEKGKIIIEISGKKLKGEIVYSVTLPQNEFDPNRYFRVGVRLSNVIDRSMVDELRVHANMKSKTTAS